MRPPLCFCLTPPQTISMFVSPSVQCVPPSVSVCGSQMFVSLSVLSVPPKNLASSSLKDGFDLAHSTLILSVALPAELVYRFFLSKLFLKQRFFRQILLRPKLDIKNKLTKQTLQCNKITEQKSNSFAKSKPCKPKLALSLGQLSPSLFSELSQPQVNQTQHKHELLLNLTQK